MLFIIGPVMLILSCEKKEYNKKIMIFDEPWCIKKGTPIWCDDERIGKITNFYSEKDYFVGEAKIDKTFHRYYSIIPYVRSEGPKGCYIGFETKNATRHEQIDTIFVTRNVM